MIKLFLFDFGGVVADEGFREGLFNIAKRNFLDPQEFYSNAKEIIYNKGYVEGRISEEEYYNELKKQFNLTDTIEDFRNEILSKFQVRDYILELVVKLREASFKTGLLTDHTNWLYELNERLPFFMFFDYIFNSYKLKKTKRDPSIFSDIVNSLKIKADEIVFIDDDYENTKRANSFGIRTIQYTSYNDFINRIRFFSGINL